MKDRKQIEKMTAKEAMQRMNKAMAHGMDLRVTDSPVRVPGRIGICRTAKGNCQGSGKTYCAKKTPTATAEEKTASFLIAPKGTGRKNIRAPYWAMETTPLISSYLSPTAGN